MRTILLLAACVLALTAAPIGPSAAASGGRIEAVRPDGQVVTHITDGDSLRLRLTLSEAMPASQAVDFVLEGGAFAAACTIEAGEPGCETGPLLALGWYGETHPAAAGSLSIVGRIAGRQEILAQGSLEVAPRPVVMVHGFASSWEAWVNYLGPTGYLAAHGIPGYAVGDGQVPGVMNTGDLARPSATTGTLIENATVLGRYVEAVKRATGAQMVDLLAHSMGGLISRAYIGRVMGERDIAQLIMLGSPMAGTDCANLPSALGLYLPATLELRPSYVTQVFNPQVNRRRGVVFHALAGVPIVDGFKSPCTDVPTDLAVALSSVTAIPLEAVRLPVLHTELNLSAQVFDDFVLPLLRAPAGAFAAQPDPPTDASPVAPIQFSRLLHGHLEAGSSIELTIPIDPGITVASFALYDTSRSLQVSVTGASGKSIELDTAKNGLVTVDDPAALFHLGYGFQDPRPGLWRVRLVSTAPTDYSMAARFVGGTELITRLEPLLPAAGDPLTLTARLRLGNGDLQLHSAEASLRRPDGSSQVVELTLDGPQAATQLSPDQAGAYGVDLLVTGSTPDGFPIERSAYLAFEVQPDDTRTISPLTWVFIVLPLGLAAGLVIGLRLRRRRRRGLA